MSVDPATATLVLTIASTAASTFGEMQTANAQADLNAQQRANELQAYRDNIQASNTQVLQDSQASTEKAQQASLEARKAKSTAITSAGEGGVTGISVDALMRELSSQGLENVNAIEANHLRRREASVNDRINLRNRTTSGLNNIQPAANPNFIGAGLQIATDFVDYRTKTGDGSLF